ncbi:hypothetical protein F3157_13285 [Virgibacillus dakarensis]|uniref:Magnesium transporter MgtE intracellular domain-containing protein n=1 Tax=Lentibacillus populi TaxID=1827502 RepID=A0A9W5TU86_9BACI|nr:MULTISPECIES: MotE family protein [Bacillaceae]MBT2216673.1 MotE family protein [Virgibacillus dakarensis]MTW86624.1 hypothetical protein [Virgibacillus dakarensis]GGB30305.1 hypothetical protein GCM10011409_04540 [Lentibacillus populi]
MGNQPKTQGKQKTNPIVWFLFAIVIPVIVAITLAIIIFTLAGVNVIDWVKNTGNNIPVISSFVTTDEEKNLQQTEEKMKAALEKKDEKIEELTQNVNDLEATIDKMEQEKLKLENRTTSDELDGSTTEQESENDTVKTISSSFKEMDPKQAALIFQKLDSDMAISILKELSNKARGKIIAEMDPETAAKLTKMFINSD